MEQLFKYFDRFNTLTLQEKEAISNISVMIHVPKNTDLHPIGNTCRTIYFMKKGIARVYYFKDSTEVTESFSFENSILARVESLFSGRPSKKGIQVLEDSELIVMDAVKLFKLYDSYQGIERLFRKIFEAAYVDTVNRIESLQFHTAEERYKALMEEAPSIINRVPLKCIASYLGITQVSLSRIRAHH